MIAVGGFLLVKALWYEPQFYRDALVADPIRQRQASDEMLRQVTGVWSDVQDADRWEVLFTAEQINGWLAVDLVENHPNVLPEDLHDPRVQITRDGFSLACRLRRDRVESVVSLAVEPYMPEANVLGLRIRRARAGLLPWPLRTITDKIARAAKGAELQTRWLQADGDPVVLISLPPLSDTKDERLIRIDTLRLGEGEVYLAGTSERP